MEQENFSEETYLEYGTNVLEHFLNPRNVGKMDDADIMTQVGDPTCGDYIELFLKMANEKIEKITYLVHGCIGAISTSSALTEMVTGMGIAEALAVTDDDVVEYLGGIPERKKHCSLLGVRGLHDAIKKYTSLKEE